MTQRELIDRSRMFPEIWGTVTRCDGATLGIRGLDGLVGVGDRMRVKTRHGPADGMIIALADELATVLLESKPDGVTVGQRAYVTSSSVPSPSRAWLGRIVTAAGDVLDGGDPLPIGHEPGRPEGRQHGLRRPLGQRLSTGLAALDTLLPLCSGQRIGVFSGSGVGKSSLISRLAAKVEADAVVIGLIGERSREVAEFAARLSEDECARTVIIAATAEESALVRRQAAVLTLQAANALKADGQHVLCIVDSLTRFAEAHREVALAAGEPPSLRAFPPSTSSALAQLCESAGPGMQGTTEGDITAVFTVLVAGSDMEEPVADMVRGVLDGHIILDRTIAERGRFPAIDMRRSVSRSAPAAWTDEEAEIAGRARAVIAQYEDSATMIQAGLYTRGADPNLDRAVDLWPQLDAFVGSQAPGAQTEDSFAMLEEILGR